MTCSSFGSALKFDPSKKDSALVSVQQLTTPEQWLKKEGRWADVCILNFPIFFFWLKSTFAPLKSEFCGFKPVVINVCASNDPTTITACKVLWFHFTLLVWLEIYKQNSCSLFLYLELLNILLQLFTQLNKLQTAVSDIVEFLYWSMWLFTIQR